MSRSIKDRKAREGRMREGEKGKRGFDQVGFCERARFEVLRMEENEVFVVEFGMHVELTKRRLA